MKLIECHRRWEWKYMPQRPINEISSSVRWLASIAAMAADLNMRQTVLVAIEFQRVIDEGRLKGKLVTGDHDEDGKTVYDWEELA
jgi:hypothetical protein